MNFEEFKKQMQTGTANIVDVSRFNDEYIKMIQNKENYFDVVVVVRGDNGEVGCLCQGGTTGTLFVEFIGSGDCFRL